jgi:hypothetical protein
MAGLPVRAGKDKLSEPVMPQFRAPSAGLQPGISPNADLKVGATSAVAPETEALPEPSAPKFQPSMLQVLAEGAGLSVPLMAERDRIIFCLALAERLRGRL